MRQGRFTSFSFRQSRPGATYRQDEDDYPSLDLTLNEREFSISRYSLKPAILDAGFVALGAEGEDLLGDAEVFSEIQVPIKGERPATVMGAYTNNPAVLRLARRFVSDLDGGQFQPGKVLL